MTIQAATTHRLQSHHRPLGSDSNRKDRGGGEASGSGGRGNAC